MDQGASFALPILECKDRYTAGLIEAEISKQMSDKTNWRDMLKGVLQEEDLEAHREDIYEQFADLLDDMNAEDLEDPVVKINYPVEQYPEKVSSLSFDKKPLIEGTLMGIKGQYLILDTGVLNIRKHQGYQIELTY